jgi:N-acetylmuramoyl-L-alanine amidase CwlA
MTGSRVQELRPYGPDWAIQQFLPINQFSRPGIKIKEVKGIVVHYVANPNSSASANRSYFEGLALTGTTYASSHFIIGLEGEVIQCVPLDEIAYASNQRNRDTISIEVCHPDASGRFTPQTYESLVRLVKWLCNEYHLNRSHVIRHHDVTGKNCPKFFVENPNEWKAFLNRI